MSNYTRLGLDDGKTFFAWHVEHIEDGIVENETRSNNFDLTIHSVNHRGYSSIAPENTIPAYIMSKKMGFTYVEADIGFTKDGVAVLLHDNTIDRTSNGSGKITELSYAELLQYDFGSWKSEEYAGTKIPTFSQFLTLCKYLGLHPYIELKSSGYTEAQIKQLVTEVHACGMQGKVSWISFNETFLQYVVTEDKTARVGYVASPFDIDNLIAVANGLKTDKNNEVFLDLNWQYLKGADVQKCIDANIPLELWTVNNEALIPNLHPYITGITSDNIIAGRLLYELGIDNLFQTDSPPSSSAQSGNLSNPVINIDMTNGSNKGIGGSTYNASLIKGGIFSDGKFTTVNGEGALTIPVDFITNANSPFTAFMIFDSWEFSKDNTFQRFFRGSGDIPCVYWSKSNGATIFKFFSGVKASDTDYYDNQYFYKGGSDQLLHSLSNDIKFVVAIRCDGERYSLWTDGMCRATQLCGESTSSNWSQWHIGEATSNGYALADLKCSKVMLWNTALSDEEMATLVS